MRRSRRVLHLDSIFAALGTVIMCAGLVFAQEKSSPKEVAPDVPDAIALRAGLEAVLFTHAKGVQVYTCEASADGKFAWTLKAPEAELRDRQDKVIGQHSAGPTWKLNDGSEVTGKAVAHVDSLDSDSVPWLLINVVTNSGKGVLAKVTTIQRVHTRGGQPGGDVCDQAHKDAESRRSYSADYYFFAPAKGCTSLSAQLPVSGPGVRGFLESGPKFRSGHRTNRSLEMENDHA